MVDQYWSKVLGKVSKQIGYWQVISWGDGKYLVCPRVELAAGIIQILWSKVSAPKMTTVLFFMKQTAWTTPLIYITIHQLGVTSYLIGFIIYIISTWSFRAWPTPRCDGRWEHRPKGGALSHRVTGLSTGIAASYPGQTRPVRVAMGDGLRGRTRSVPNLEATNHQF